MKESKKAVVTSLAWSMLMFSLLTLILPDNLAGAHETSRPCGDEFTKPKLEFIRDKDLQETDPYRVRSAMQELGERRCVDAINELIGFLTYRFPHPKQDERLQLEPIFTGTRYPATSALFAIGKPALPALLKVIETNDADSLEAKSARYTIRAIFREEPTDADKFFKSAAAKARTPASKQRLLKALETPQSEDFKSD